MPKPKLDFKEIFFPALSLFVICLVTALAVAGVNEITKGSQGDDDTVYQKIFPEARFVDQGEYYTAYEQNGTLIGYCIDTEAQGYGGPIKVTVCINTQGNVLRVQVIDCGGETPGLGTKIQDESFLQQFLGGFKFFLKGDLSVISAATMVDSIASATYSSRGVVDAVNKAMQIYNDQIYGGGEAQ